MKLRLPPGTRVAVTWYDAAIDQGEDDFAYKIPRENPDIQIQVTVGHFIRSDGPNVVVAMDCAPDWPIEPSYRTVVYIPWRMVRKIEKATRWQVAWPGRRASSTGKEQ